jgi:nitrite reductase/ring-hydroxylating ferredoxin subunit
MLEGGGVERGQMKRVEVSGRSLLLVRRGGQGFAISNPCLHEGVTDQWHP